MKKTIIVTVLACIVSFGAGSIVRSTFEPASGGSVHVGIHVYPQQHELTLKDMKDINAELDEWRISNLDKLRAGSSIAAIQSSDMGIEIRFSNLKDEQIDSLTSIVRNRLSLLSGIPLAEQAASSNR
jgi:type 1 fimbria pilin